VRVVRTIPEVREALAESRDGRDRIGLVPTMGAFHEGHVALMRSARDACETVVVSLFVNPAQFSEADDLSRYPRDEAADARVAEAAGVDVLFAPSETELYPPGFATWVEPGAAAEGLEGAARPGHFRGVATVCAKLFAIVAPHAAFFGQKDAQQVAVVRQVVRDLNLAVEVVAVPTVRDSDGLALSSRNRFLTPGERARAIALPRALEAGAAAHRTGGDAVGAARASLAETPDVAVDYVELADLDGPTLLAAVRIGSTRLIDNISLS
jgi:pantoate--beta-alanine ligase